MTVIVIVKRHLPYVSSLQSRSSGSIDMIVIHCTELPDLQMAREYGERIHYPETGTGNSGHYYIERSGKIEQWVPPLRVAHHVRGFNERSLGIELDNPGRYPAWFDSANQQMQHPYSAEQINGLIILLHQLTLEFPSIQWIAGHDQLDTASVAASDNAAIKVFRKRDPGPLFPWKKILAASGLSSFTV